MEIIPQNLFFQRHNQLSDTLIDYSFTDNFNNTLAEAYKLGKIEDPNKQLILHDLVKAVLFIIVPKEDFKQEIIEKLDISPIYAEIINQIIQKRIFEPLKDELEKYSYLLPKKTLSIPQTTESPNINSQKPLTIPQTKESSNINAQKPLTIPQTKESSNINPIKSTISKENITQSLKPSAEQKTNVFISPEEKENQLPSQPVPEISLPEVTEIKIERPVNKTNELKKVSPPSVTPEIQQQIHSRLLEAMKKQQFKPKIVDKMKKIAKEGQKQTPPAKPKQKIAPIIETPLASQIISGENHNLSSEENKKSALEKPYILDVKLKEEKETKPKELPEKEIKYQKIAEKPFGEA